MDRYFSLDLAVLREIEAEIVEVVNIVLSGIPGPQIVTTTDAKGFVTSRFMVKMDDDGQTVLSPIPAGNSKGVMSHFDLLVASSIQLDWFPGYFLPGDPHILGTVIVD